VAREFKIKVAEILEATVGGTRTHMELLLEHIDKSKFDVTLVCSTARNPQFTEELSKFENEGIKVRVINMVREVSPLRDALSLLQLYFYLRGRSFDVVHTHSSKAGMLGRLAARWASVPAIIHTPHAFAFQGDSNRLARRLFLKAERLAGRWTTALLCVSEGERQVAIKNKVIEPRKALVIDNSVDLKPVDHAFDSRPSCWPGSDPAQRGLVVGTVADLRPQKGLGHFIRAAKYVLERPERVSFLIIGHGWLRDELNALIASCHIQERVKIISVRKDIWQYYALMDVFVLTSLWEGLPYAILEAMAMSKPVVATDISGCRDIVVDGKTGLLVPPRDDRAIAGAILKLLADAPLRKRMGEQGRQLVEQKYRIESKIKELEKTYERLCAGSCMQT
jgi:glycosyltransferase involved in cell wall biosynthesis